MSAMKELQAKMVTPMAKREAVGLLTSEMRLSKRRSCRIAGLRAQSDSIDWFHMTTPS